MGQHANLGASNASIWLKCAVAGREMRNVKGVSGTSIHAATGTVAHTLGELALIFGDEILEDKIGDVITVEKYDIPITEDMVKAVKVYTKYANEIIEKADLHETERRVSLNPLYKISGRVQSEELFGTADLTAFCIADDIVDVVDYKHGAGVPVEADTPQGKYYALGVMLAMKANRLSPAKFRVSIVQPRAPHIVGPIRSVTYTRQDLVDFGNEVMVAVDNIVTGRGGYVSGQHCRFCPLAGPCPKLYEENLALAAGDFHATKDAIPYCSKKPADNHNLYAENQLLSEKELAFILDRRDLFRRWLDKVEQEAMSRLHNSKVVPGWKLVAKRARNVWSDTAEDDMEQSQFDTTGLYEKKIISPARAKGVLSPDTYQYLTDNGLIQNRSVGVSLAPSSDKRAEVHPSEFARTDFEDAPDETEE